MKKKIKILFFIIALLIILILLFMFKNTFASYVAKITGNSSSEVAMPIFILESSDKKILNDENTEVDYYFKIKNYNENGERSQTNLSYFIEVSPKLDSSIVLTLYKDNKPIILNNQKTDYIEMTQERNEIHSYRLNVKYDREKTNSTIDIKENIFIKASAIQS